MTDKNGVEIDYCPDCRGVWLDRGELEKILERTSTHYSDRSNYVADDKKYQNNQSNDYYKSHPHKKKKSFLNDIFDF